jgi:hypothetical protein
VDAVIGDAGAAAELEPLAAGYELVLAIAGPVLMRYPTVVDALARRLKPCPRAQAGP